MKVIVDAETCIGCCLCTGTPDSAIATVDGPRERGICPEVFEMGDDDIAIVKVNEVPPELQDACQDAAEQCPVEAISIEE